MPALALMFSAINSESNTSCCLRRHWPGNWSVFIASECQHRHVCEITVAARPHLFIRDETFASLSNELTPWSIFSLTKRFFIKCLTVVWLMIIDETSSTGETRCQLKNSRWISRWTDNKGWRGEAIKKLRHSDLIVRIVRWFHFSNFNSARTMSRWLWAIKTKSIIGWMALKGTQAVWLRIKLLSSDYPGVRVSRHLTTFSYRKM